MLDEFAQRVFDKSASSKASKSTFLLDKFARRGDSSLKLGTLLDSVNAPLHWIDTLVRRPPHAQAIGLLSK
jgi:hypothetical protein